ncbi:MAG: class II fumarate hydratase [Ignavibacteriae bacterium]|nr:MAG: class II fumarate hydratase [Ignavibacteriota bacterium]
MENRIIKESRIEKDSLGEIKVPADAYWGAQTQRAIENFPISGIPFPPVFIHALAFIKKSSMIVHRDLKSIDSDIADAVIRACDEILEDKFSDQFPLDIFQTGSGTSTNMNINEVLATRANELLTGKRDSTSPVHPNDHVNKGQSSNDVIPTAIHIAASIQVKNLLFPAMDLLAHTLEKKQNASGSVVKTGRTHLMDAMPMTLGQELSGWYSQVENAKARIESTLPRLSELALGGTAVGTGINTQKDFGSLTAAVISQLTAIEFREARNHFEAQSSQDAIVELSGQLKTYAAALMKISNDLRWMNSGPIAGLAEIRLPELQPGSSIMPGKVNPVIPEAVRMVAVQVIGNDTVITIANTQGEFQLNVMLPVIAYTIIQSLTLLANASRLLAYKTIEHFEVNIDHLADLIHRNPIIATVLAPVIGYDKTAEVIKKARKENKTVKQVAVEMQYLTAEEAENILNPYLMTRPGLL